MEKIISLSLYDNLPIYSNGAIQNAKLLPSIYGNDWKIRFYIRNVKTETIDELKRLGAEIVDMNKSDIKNGMMHRFLAVKKNNIVLIRDCDSIITNREKMMVDQFLNSKKKLHIIRDHPNHKEHMMGCSFGFNNSEIDIEKLIYQSDLRHNPAYMVDQIFLAKIIYPIFEGNMLIHDNFNKFYRERNELVIKWPRQINHIGQRIMNDVGEDTNRLNEFRGYIKFTKNKFKSVEEMMVNFCNYLSVSNVLKRKYVVSELYVNDELVVLDDYIIIKELLRYTFIIVKYESEDEFLISSEDMGCDTIKLSEIQKINELKEKDVLIFDIEINNDLQYDPFTLYNVIQLNDEINYKIDEYLDKKKLNLYDVIVSHGDENESLKEQFPTLQLYKDLFNDFSEYKIMNEFVRLYCGMFRIHIKPSKLIIEFSKRYWHQWDDNFKII